MPKNTRQFVRLRRVHHQFSQVTAVQTMTHGGPSPRGFLEVPANTPEVKIGSIFRNGQPPAELISGIPVGAAVTGFEGMGDSIYMRGPLKKLLAREGTIYLTNPWPQFFWDMPSVKMVRPTECALRTQMENANSMPDSVWHAEPPGLRWYEYKYNNDQLRQGKTPITTFMEQFRVADPIDFSLSTNPVWMTRRIAELPRPIGIVHPPSVRREWTNTARNPKMEYLQTVIDSRPDIFWVSVGWLKDGQEWPDGAPLSGIRQSFDHGELSMTEVLALVSVAKITLCGPSFPLPVSAALGTPVFCVFGGSIPPRCLVDPRMGRHAGYAAPEPFCECFSNDHACNKIIDRERVLNEFRRLMALP